MKIKIILLSLFFIFALSLTATAQNEIQQAVEADENISAQDLTVSQPKVLPGSIFYPFKNLIRGVQSFLTRDPIKKAELKLKFTNEKIIEVKTLAEKTEKPEILKKTLDNYNQELKQLENTIQKIKEEQPEKIDKFLNKFIDNQVKHQKLIGKFEKEMPQETLGKVAEIKAKSIEQLSTIPLGFEKPEQFQERIEKIMEEQSGSEFKHFKNLEVLKEVEQKVPEQAKPSIQQAQENVFKRLEKGIGIIEVEIIQPPTEETSGGEAALIPAPAVSAKKASEEFTQYIQEIGGNKKYQQEIIKQLEQGGQIEVQIDIIEIPESAPSIPAPSGAPSIPGEPATSMPVQEEEPSAPSIPGVLMPVPEKECMVQITCEMGYIPYDTGKKDSSGCPIMKCSKEGGRYPYN